MKRILIIHPEGNVANNLNLYAIVSKLLDFGIRVDILGYKRNGIVQKDFFKTNFSFKTVKNSLFCGSWILKRILEGKIGFREKKYILKRGYEFILGVDEGIISASAINNVLNIPYGLISYEIFPRDETDDLSKKEKEIESCQSIRFAICQDKVRADLLSLENKIPLEKILLVPLGGLEAKKIQKNFILHEKLGISKQKKLAIVIGTIDKWSMTEKIIESAEKWKSDWALVVHSRYEGDPKLLSCIKKYSESTKVFFSNKSFTTCEEMDNLLSSVSLGIAMYNPTFENKWTGLNIEKIGMSSGKIATYLRYGIPVITNEIGEMSDYIKEFNLGRVVTPDKGINVDICAEDLNLMSENCIKYYERKLYIGNSLSKIMSSFESEI